MDTLAKRVNQAQENGNVLHEMGFSMRDDWIVENMLFDSDTRQLDQDKLKRSSQHIVQDLCDKDVSSLPLGEGDDDVVWGDSPGYGLLKPAYLVCQKNM